MENLTQAKGGGKELSLSCGGGGGEGAFRGPVREAEMYKPISAEKRLPGSWPLN